MKIALVHYAYPPTIGGVEFIMEQHVALFARHGYSVAVLCGRGASEIPGVRVSEIPELHPGNRHCKRRRVSIARSHPAW